MCNNAFIGDGALCNLSIKGKAGAGIGAFTEALDLVQNEYGEGASAWRLKIYPMTDAISDAAPFTTGSSFQPIFNADNVPAAIANATAIYNAFANGGTITNPEWNLLQQKTAGLSGNLKAGRLPPRDDI